MIKVYFKLTDEQEDEIYLTITNNNFLTWSLQCVRAETGGGAGLHLLAPFPPSYFPTYALTYLITHFHISNSPILTNTYTFLLICLLISLLTYIYPILQSLSPLTPHLCLHLIIYYPSTFSLSIPLLILSYLSAYLSYYDNLLLPPPHNFLLCAYLSYYLLPLAAYFCLLL